MTRRTSSVARLAVAGLLFVAPLLSAQTSKRPLTLDDLPKLRSVGDPQVFGPLQPDDSAGRKGRLGCLPRRPHLAYVSQEQGTHQYGQWQDQDSAHTPSHFGVA